MRQMPKKYMVACKDTANGKVLMEEEFEAISRQEAETRGLLNCIKAGGSKNKIEITAR
jgi:hypothetical protein